jgi:hypothetical protein
MLLVWFRWPMIVFRVPFVQCPVSMQWPRSWTHSFVFSGVRNTRNHRESISQPRMTLHSSSFPSALCFVMFTMGSLLLGSLLSIGLNRVSRMRGTACLICCEFPFWSRQAWMKLSMKLSVIMSCGDSGTRRSLVCPNGMSLGSCNGGKSRLKVECSSWGFQWGFWHRSWARSPPAISLMQLNFVGAGVEPNGAQFKRYAMSSMMVMHVAAVDMLVWRRQ